MNDQERNGEAIHEGQQRAIYKRLNPGVDFDTWKAQQDARREGRRSEMLASIAEESSDRLTIGPGEWVNRADATREQSNASSRWMLEGGIADRAKRARKVRKKVDQDGVMTVEDLITLLREYPLYTPVTMLDPGMEKAQPPVLIPARVDGSAEVTEVQIASPACARLGTPE